MRRNLVIAIVALVSGCSASEGAATAEQRARTNETAPTTPAAVTPAPKVDPHVIQLSPGDGSELGHVPIAEDFETEMATGITRDNYRDKLAEMYKSISADAAAQGLATATPAAAASR